MNVPAFSNEDTAIVVVDPYNDFMSARGKLWPALRRVSKQVNAIKNLQRIISTGRMSNVPIVYAPHQRYRTGQFAGRKYLHPSHVGIKSLRVFEDGKFGGQFFGPLAPIEGDLVSSPHACSSGFAETDLHEKLRGRGISHIIIIGYTSNTCVEATARSAVDLDYRITLVSDAVASWTPVDHHAAVSVNYPCLTSDVLTTEALVPLLRQLGDAHV
ncbi:Peroxyureidoacrylate/ureidoacrylate amidohydrolase RutB [Planctomycetes bacterium CA13]|uniref:Peroxyureidoacrylate/ureidoacrylate amidohydrolase RutB n=1 Tax=Novipirellula herctigrandis TaxID=2527986 RepID=A0A5C5YYJ4_9BACT|nr:Peroxyureidoacrylate/ureidoacrylate amidohydrolase RutB [Planctomycetes bacterium CA13]